MSPITKETLYTMNNGLTIPAAGFGVYLSDPKVTSDIVYEALKAGYRHVDSARAYSNEEESANGIAKYLADHPEVKRSEVFYTTKIRNEDHGYENSKKIIEVSLEKAKSIGYIDLFLVHSPMSNTEKRLGTWRALQEAVESGKVKSIGVSNYGVKHLKELMEWTGLTVKPVVNQIELHPWLPRLDIQEYSKQHGILLEAYAPLTQGKKLDEPQLVAFSKKYGWTPAQILLKWSYDQGFIVLAKTVSVPRIKENLSVFDITLPDDVAKAFHLPDSYEVLSWDPTIYEDPK